MSKKFKPKKIRQKQKFKDNIEYVIPTQIIKYLTVKIKKPTPIVFECIEDADGFLSNN